MTVRPVGRANTEETWFMISLAPAVSRPGWAACLSLAIGLTLAPATLPAQD